MTRVYLNSIATAVPDHDVHQKFVAFAPFLLRDDRERALFSRMVDRSQIQHRYSPLQPHADPALLDTEGFYRREAFPDTKARMQLYERHAFGLARRAVDQMDLAGRRAPVTHLIVTTCTGFYAPGLDLQIVEHYGLNPSVERSVIGFMGCYAAINALKLARHIVRSRPDAQVLIVNLELCTLHLQNTGSLEDVLSFLIFADGCAASIVSAEESGIEIQGFHATILPGSGEQITWNIGASGFDMNLSGRVPATVAAALPRCLPAITAGRPSEDIAYWAVHPGGRSILDAVEQGAALPPGALRFSRDVLRDFGNMSSSTVMFVLKAMMRPGNVAGEGCAMAFGPGVTVESMMFRKLGDAS